MERYLLARSLTLAVFDRLESRFHRSEARIRGSAETVTHLQTAYPGSIACSTDPRGTMVVVSVDIVRIARTETAVAMLAFASVWIALASLLLAIAMVVYRPAFTDLYVTAVLYFGAPGAMCLAGMLLWAYRKEDDPDPGLVSQRLQAKVAIGLSIVASAIVYVLVMFAEQRPRIEG